MSATVMYKVCKDGHVEQVQQFGNAWHGAMSVWMSMSERYLGRAFDMSNPQATWDISKTPGVPREYAVTLLSTFDMVMVRRRDMPELIRCFRAFVDEFGKVGGRGLHLDRQADFMETLLEDDDCDGVCWNQTDVVESPWVATGDDGEEEPYNVQTCKRHWFMLGPGEPGSASCP